MANRLNYYFRQKVTEGELDEGFALLEQADNEFITDSGLVGIVSGLAVTQRGAGANLSVDVSAGTAYDKNGARIHTSSTQNVLVSTDESAVSTTVAGVGNSKILSVFAKFDRVLTDPRTDGNSVTVYFEEAEGFEFVVRQGAEGVSPTAPPLDPEYILLADITRVYGDTTIVNAAIASTGRREDCFVQAGASFSLRRGRIKDAFDDTFDALNSLQSGTTDIDNAPVAATYMFGLSSTNLSDSIEAIRNYLDYGPRGEYISQFNTAGSPYTLSSQRVIHVDTTGGAVTINLPAPAHGIRFKIKDAAGTFGTNACTLVRNGSEEIEGVAASLVLSAPGGTYEIWSDGTDWFI